MRLVEVSVPAGKRGAVIGVLEDEGIDYVLTEETGRREYTHVVSFPIPAAAVEPVLERLREVGVGQDSYTIVTEPRAVTSRQYEELEERYVEEEGGQEAIARDELAETAEGNVSDSRTYVVLTAVSAVIATAGLLLDSPATVVGSMVIAPLIGPAMSTAVGSVINDKELFTRGVRMQVLGMVLAVLTAAAFAFFVRTTNLVPPGLEPESLREIEGRLSPDFLSLAVALGAGVAGALSLTTGVSAALVGVMIAVALVPPAATVGIGIAYGQPAVAIPSAILATVNVLSINLAALAVLWYTGYRPNHILRRNEARSATIKRGAVLVVAIALLSVFLGGITLNTYQVAQGQNDIRGAVESTMETGPYTEATLLSIETKTRTTSNTLGLTKPSEVIVTVGVPPGWEYRDLASRLQDRIEAKTGQSMPVEVRYVRIQRTGADESAVVDGERDVAPSTRMAGSSMRQAAV